MNNTVVAVFARAPVLGKVKTRIAVDTDDSVALALYQQMLRITLEQVRASGLSGVIAATDIGSQDLQVLGDAFGFGLVAQGDGDLGDRMANVFRLLHRSYRHVIIIGSDCPVMDSTHLCAMAQQLQQDDMVIMPAEDGGYVAIGSAVAQLWQSSDIFRGVRWSTVETFKQSLSCLHALGANVTMLDTLWDVDSLDDVQRAVRLGKLELPLA